MVLAKTSRILIVDDSPAILALLRDMLRTRGYPNVVTAASVQEGLARVEEAPPDMVFLDLMMPDSSGIEFAKRALEKDPHLRIVVTTALPASAEPVVTAISQGVADYMQKPIRKETLGQVMDRVWRDDEPHGLYG